MYTLTTSGILKKGEQVIALDDSTPEYQAFLEWLREGNGPEIIDVPVLPRIVVSPWQLRKALNRLGMRQAIEAAVSASDDIEVKDGWEFATQFESDNSLILAMRTAFGMSEEQMYAVFQLAETL